MQSYAALQKETCFPETCQRSSFAQKLRLRKSRDHPLCAEAVALTGAGEAGGVGWPPPSLPSLDGDAEENRPAFTPRSVQRQTRTSILLQRLADEEKNRQKKFMQWVRKLYFFESDYRNGCVFCSETNHAKRLVTFLEH
jgi:hypothetical protein